jgi:hypothetical protein
MYLTIPLSSTALTPVGYPLANSLPMNKCAQHERVGPLAIRYNDEGRFS